MRKFLGLKMATLYYLSEYEVFYLKIAKTSGQSMVNYFMDNNINWANCGHDLHHLVDCDYKRSFCFVRNPYDRLVSLYKNVSLKGYEMWDHPLFRDKLTVGEVLNNEFTFSDPDKFMKYDHRKLFRAFVDNLLSLSDYTPTWIGELVGYVTWRDYCRSHTMPYTDSYIGADKIESIGRFENLRDDWLSILNRYGVPAGELPFHNHYTTKRGYDKPYQEFYDSYSFFKITEFYKKDLEVFNYKF